MIVVENDFGGRLLPKTELLACLIPEPMAVGGYLRCFHTVHYDAAVVGEHGQYFLYDFFQSPSVSANKDGIRAGHGSDVCLQEISYMYMDARCTEAACVLLDDGLALRAYFEGFDVQVWELQAGLYRDRASAEADIPEHMLARQF